MNTQSKVAKAPTPYITVEGGLPGEDPREKFRYLNMLIHSPGGHGKTTFLATACDDPRTSPILVADMEGGAALRFAKKDPSTYTIRHVRSINDLNQLYEYLAKGDHPYKSFAIDSLTEVQKLGLFEFVYGTKPDMSFSGNVINVKTAELQHWAKSKTQIEMLVRYFRDLPIHTFFTTLTQTIRDELTGKVTTTIALPGKQADEIPGIPDIVGYLGIVKTKENPNMRALMVQPDGRIVCKDRTDALGDVVLEPTVSKVLDAIWKAYGIE